VNATRIVTAVGLILAPPLASTGSTYAAGLADAPRGATSCSGCHPAARGVDTTVPRLVGRNPADIVAAMQAFRSGERASTVMGSIAHGFSDEEVKAIAAWYGAQKD
jgi:cytochrome subunit of sulfide dehydrogenase